MQMQLLQGRLIVVLAVVCLCGSGCSSLKSLKSRFQAKKSYANVDEPEDDTEVSLLNPAEKRISLLQARASLAEMDKQPVEAMQSYELILELDPNHVVALHRLALLKVQQGSYQDADKRFQAALRCAPDNALIHNDYGYFCHLQSRPAEAISHLTKAVELKPDYLAAHNNLGLVLAGEGQNEAAERHFRLAKCDQAETLNNLALARFMQSDLDDAASLYNRALKVDPNHQLAQSSLASLNRITRPSAELEADTSPTAPIAPASFNGDDGLLRD